METRGCQGPKITKSIKKLSYLLHYIPRYLILLHEEQTEMQVIEFLLLCCSSQISLAVVYILIWYINTCKHQIIKLNWNCSSIKTIKCLSSLEILHTSHMDCVYGAFIGAFGHHSLSLYGKEQHEHPNKHLLLEFILTRWEENEDRNLLFGWTFPLTKEKCPHVSCIEVMFLTCGVLFGFGVALLSLGALRACLTGLGDFLFKWMIFLWCVCMWTSLMGGAGRVSPPDYFQLL